MNCRCDFAVAAMAADMTADMSQGPPSIFGKKGLYNSTYFGAPVITPLILGWNNPSETRKQWCMKGKRYPGAKKCNVILQGGAPSLVINETHWFSAIFFLENLCHYRGPPILQDL